MSYSKNSKLAILGVLVALCIAVSAVNIVLWRGRSQEAYIPRVWEEISTNPRTGVRSWGIKRNTEGKTPDADPGTAELLREYGGLYVGDTSKPTIFLTFDEGYDTGNSEKILDVLKENDVKAIFFITGDFLEMAEDLTRRMVEEGHEVGNHTYNHPSLPSLSKEQIEEELLSLDRSFKKKFGRNMRFLRPPKGEYNDFSLSVTHSMSYINLFWSFAYDDWNPNKQRGADYARQKVIENLHNGAIILLHSISVDNVNALDSIIREAREKGFTFGTPDELARFARSERE